MNIADKTVTIHQFGEGAHERIVYLNMYQDSSRAIIDELRRMDTPPFTLVAISGLKWDNDMTPWACPPISKGDTPCEGRADDYLTVLTGQIIPRVEADMGTPHIRGIAGYSLGGLFALYTLYRTDTFNRAASMSGSLWYPDWMKYANEHSFVQLPKCVYLSLGDKECATRNKYLKCVQENTEQYYALLQKQGIAAQFTLNSGNHFVDAARRTATGIAWITSYLV